MPFASRTLASVLTALRRSATLDTYAPTVDWNAQILLADNLTRGEHIVKIEVTGRKREPSTDAYVQITGFNFR